MTAQRSLWLHPWGLAAIAALLAFAILTLAWRRPDGVARAITDDWQGWRQADTQAMARNQAFVELDPISPRIDWGGDGPGYVEAEMPIYPAVIGLALRWVGDREWPGQLLSLLCVLAAAALLFAALARRFGPAAGWLALVSVLSGQGAIVIATSIQPDTLAFLAFTIGWLAFLAYLEQPRWRSLLWWVSATAIAGLVKPTTLELGLAQGLLCLLAHRRALRDLRLWLGWAVVLGVVALYLWHAHQLYVTHGNTFGVLSGGDSKLPALDRLRQLSAWTELARYAVVWGIGLPGLLAALFLLARRDLGAEPLALAVAALALGVLAFRYTAGPFGTHYHLPHAVLGAWLVARAVAAVWPAGPPPTADASRTGAAGPWLRRAVLAALLLAALAQTARAVRFVRRLPPQPETALGQRLIKLAPPRSLIAVRARAEAYNQEWHTTNNFEDPRVFYLSRTRGWVLPNDLDGAAATARLDEVVARGARFYVHVRQVEPDAELRAWLATHAQLVDDSAAGQIYALRSK